MIRTAAKRFWEWIKKKSEAFWEFLNEKITEGREYFTFDKSNSIIFK